MERILTLHPQGKKGVNISLEKYEAMRHTLLDIIKEKGKPSFEELCDEAEARLKGNFEGAVMWYVVSVKLDLEARGIIRRLKGKGSHRLEIAGTEGEK